MNDSKHNYQLQMKRKGRTMADKNFVDELKDKVNDALEKTDIDDKIKGKVDEVLEKTDIDDKIKEKVDEIKGKF